MNDEQIHQKGGSEQDVNEYAKSNGADLTKEDFQSNWKVKWKADEDIQLLFHDVNKDLNWSEKHVLSFISKEIIEKIIEEIPDYTQTGITYSHNYSLKEDLRTKWLSNE